ncbi:MAG: DUF1275 domain-containing protein [Spirochaetes bacterium]|uniref:DUF1275 domain-containing protein n=1 Tax=Candidatus Ornithospirochaeta stercoripullorum TaxID=2840899 RepID=A0A9D9E4T3_9SPIO|nr:DUF1275 domain-containing protein [Candidatus Ornithospirochaeta stercoripullorum]
MQEKSRNKVQASESIAVMILITLSGGLQDAYTYITRAGVFANAQTGNIVLLSRALFLSDWGRAFSYLIPITAYAAGILVAALLRHRFQKHNGILHWRHIVVLAEILLLSSVSLLPTSVNSIANAIVSFSCAMQVEAFRKARGHAYASTMCIGNLKSCMENLSDFIVEKKEGSLKNTLYYALVIIVFAAGAGSGALLSIALGIPAILFSSFLLLLSFILMLRRS